MEELNIMAKKQSTKKRTQVKDLPRKEKKLSAGEAKKVKGGFNQVQLPSNTFKAGDGSVRPQDTSLKKPEGTEGGAVVSLGKLG